MRLLAEVIFAVPLLLVLLQFLLQAQLEQTHIVFYVVFVQLRMVAATVRVSVGAQALVQGRHDFVLKQSNPD